MQGANLSLLHWKWKSLSCVQLFSTPRTVAHRLFCPWSSPGKNTRVGCYFLLQGNFLTQGSNPSLPHWQANSLPLSHQGSTHTYISSVRFSRSVMSDSLWPHEPQHDRPPCPSPTLGIYPTHVHWVGEAIQPSHPLLSPSLPGPVLCKLGQPGVLFVLPEVLTPVLRPSFVLFLRAFPSLSFSHCHLDSFFLF